jgi:hypothetical protein
VLRRVGAGDPQAQHQGDGKELHQGAQRMAHGDPRLSSEGWRWWMRRSKMDLLLRCSVGQVERLQVYTATA